MSFEGRLRFARVDDATVEIDRQRARAQTRQRIFSRAAEVALTPSPWEPCVQEGDASLRIVESGQSHDCDLVVLGQHGRSATADRLLGSMTRHALVAGSADLPVSARRGT